MKKISCKRGFTLIELLVVVLIIGILAAVAVPQYQKSVEKSRATEALTNLRAIAKAQQVYRLANGKMATTFDELDINISGKKEGSELKTKFFTYKLSGLYTSTNNVEVIAHRIDNNIDREKYSIYISYTGDVFCVAKTEATKPICQKISGSKYNSPNNGYYYYPFGKNFYTK